MACHPTNWIKDKDRRRLEQILEYRALDDEARATWHPTIVSFAEQRAASVARGEAKMMRLH